VKIIIPRSPFRKCSLVWPALGVLVLAVGCSEQPTASSRRSPEVARFDFADNPSSPSPIIIRRDGVAVRVITVDAVAGIMAIHGPVDDLAVCNNGTTRDLVDGQQINTPSDAQGIRLLLKASDTHVEIYAGTDISQVFPFVAAKFCAFIAATPKLYEGVVKYSVNLGSSMASFRWEGDVARSEDAAAFHYVENQDVVDPSNGSSKPTSSFIRLHAIGGR
jgi:hypothetical protein